MKHYHYLTQKQQEQLFEKLPSSFTKDTDKEMLGLALGALLYMPATQNFLEKILHKEYEGLTSFVMCFEDAIKEDEIEAGYENVKHILSTIHMNIQNGTLQEEEVPLVFIRVRNTHQFKELMERLTKEEIIQLTGFSFPKFTSVNAREYLETTKYYAEKHETKLYGMPILESAAIIHQETRIQELQALQKICIEYEPYVLNIRVGGTDFSSLFGIRRNMEYTIYDVTLIGQCLSDILNFFLREPYAFVCSAPVWEYFKDKQAVKGLIEEIKRDKNNGYIGKTVIHPSQVRYVNAYQAVTKEEYEDALAIFEEKKQGGILKSHKQNKMNETNPHKSWARKILKKAHVFGVLKESTTYEELL